MPYWKKIVATFLLVLVITPSLLPGVIFAENITGVPAGVGSIVTCPPGQQPSTSGKSCVAVPIPPTTIGTATSGPCAGLSGTGLTNCQNSQAAAGTLQQFNPNVNISSGNTYGGVSISGVGGAIASCANVGSFLVNGAAKLLANTAIGKKVKSLFSNVSGSDSGKVQTTDSNTTDQLKTINRTSQCLDGVAYAVAKNTLAQVTNKTLNWVNTGLNGNPLYVQNVGSYLYTIQNQQVNSFLSNVQTTDPIFGNALRSAITYNFTGRSDGLLNTPLNTPQAKAYNSFMGDFTSGGWNALLNPANNPVGALFNAADTLSNNIASSQQAASNEIQRGTGFLDMKRCVQPGNPSQTNNTTLAIQNGLANKQNCTQWVTDTPGSIIANQVAAITTSPTRQLEYANKINEVLGNFFDSFVNNLLSKGLRGSGSTQKIDFGFSSQGSNIVTDTSGNPLSTSSSAASSLGYQSSSVGGVSTSDFDVSRPQQLYNILQTQYNFLNITQDSQIALERVIPTIGALDYCIPGPNPEWQTGLDSNWQTFLSSIQQADPKDKTGVEKVLDVVPVVGGLLGGIIGLFTGSGDLPALWSANSVLTDKVTGSGIQLDRTFYAPSGHSDDLKTSDLDNGLAEAHDLLLSPSQYGYFTTKGNTFAGSPVGDAFKNAAAGDSDPLYVDGFLQDAYTETDSLTGYNAAVSEIDQQYDQNISDTQNDIRQLEIIRQQVNAIVSKAKTRYIAQRKAAGNPVDMACLNKAYQVDNSTITGIARREPNDNNVLHVEEDQMVQHANDSANYFYGNEIK